MQTTYRRVLLTLVVSLAIASSLAADEPATPVAVLPNGLTVIVRENHAAPVASVRVFVRTGSMVEGRYLGSGISHLTEHLVSGGSTKWHPEVYYDNLRAKLGGNGNASTSSTTTRYYIDTTGENVFKAVDVLSEWMQGASIAWHEYTREMGVVTRELELSLDRPGTILYYAALGNVYKVHPVRHPIIGYLEQLKRLTRDDVVRYYNERYVPNNMIVVAVGDFDAAKVKAHIAKAFSKSKRGTLPAVVLPREPEQVGPRRVILENDAVRVARLRLQYRTVSLTHADLYPLDVASYILSRGDSSRLVRKLRDEMHLVSRISTYSHTPHWGPGVFSVNAELNVAKMKAVTAAAVAEMDRLKTELVTEEELARAKTQKIAEHQLARQTVGQQAEHLGSDYLATFDADFGRRYTRNIQKVTPEQIRDVARRYFREDKLCLTALVPKGTGAAVAPALPALPASPVRRVVLPNGVVLLVKRNSATPLVSVRAVMMGGVLAETRRDNGVTRFVSNMLRRGTTTRSAQQIARTFEDLGTSLKTGSGRNSFFVGMNVLSKDLPKAMTVFADVLLRPSFPEDELAEIRRRMLFNIKRSEGDAMGEAERFFRENLFLKGPYGMMPIGTTASVARLTRDDLVRFHRRYVHPLNVKVAIFGDVETAEAERLARRYLGAFRGQGAFRPPRQALEPPLIDSRTALKVSRKQGAVVFIGAHGLAVNDVNDRATVAVIDTILSGYGYPRGWLHAALRGAGLVYVVHAYNQPGVGRPGAFIAYARCQPARVKDVSRIMLENVRRIAISGASADEIATAKTLIVTSERLWKQKNESEATVAALNELFGVGHAYDRMFLQRVRRVTNVDIKRVARKYFRHYVLTVTAPDAKIADGVRPKPRIVGLDGR